MNHFQEKKHRLPREAYRGNVTVSITACIHNRRTPFVEEPIVRFCTEKLAEAASRFNCQVLVFCFMPDHLHLILQGQGQEADTWRALVQFKQQTGFWFSRQRPEFSWQKDFHDHVLRSNEDLGAHIRYIVNNPVRQGIVTHWQDYPYTGALGIELRVVLADTTTQ